MATAATATRKPRISPTTQIMIGLVLGLIAGVLINNYNRDLVEIIRPFSAIFIRMIRMIIAPLVFGRLVAGLAGGGHVEDGGRIGRRRRCPRPACRTAA